MNNFLQARVGVKGLHDGLIISYYRSYHLVNFTKSQKRIDLKNTLSIKHLQVGVTMSIFPEKDYDSSFYHLAFRESRLIVLVQRPLSFLRTVLRNHVLIILYLWCVDF